MSRNYKIGDVSRFFHVSIQTLRYYDKKGLLIPAESDETTGYRYYSWHQFERLRLIIFLKELGLPLKTIKEQIDMPQSDEYLRTLESYRDVLQARIDEDTARKRYIDDKINFIRLATSLPQNRVLFLRFPEQRIFRYDKPITNFEENEIAVVDFIDKCHLSSGISRIGQIFSPDNLTRDGVIMSTSMYVFEEKDAKLPAKSSNIHKDVFREGLYATVFYQRRTEDTLPFIYELLHEVSRHSFKAQGDVIRSIVFDVGDCEHKGSGYLACLRILVKEL